MGALLLLSLLSTEPARPVVSVLYFDNQTSKPEYDVLRKGFADMVVTDLVAWDGVTVVERDRLEAVLTELKLQQSKSFDKATAAKVGKLIGAQYLLMGSLLMQGDSTLRIDARIVTVDGGKNVASASVTGDKNTIFDLEQELVSRLTAGIDAKLRDASARRRVKVPDFDALLAYSKAIDLGDQGKLAEAQAAMQAVVSKAPAFLMARERKQQLLKQLEEFEKRKKDMTTGSVLELGKLADETLKGAPGFDTLDEAAQKKFLAMRMLKARVMLRVLKQHLSWRREHLRIALKGHEAQALSLEHAWVENQKQLMDEVDRFQRLHAKFYYGLPMALPSQVDLAPETDRLLRDAKMGTLHISENHLLTLVAFVLGGRAVDGDESYTLAPALGDVDAKEGQATFALMDKTLADLLARYPKAAAGAQPLLEHEATSLLELDAQVLERLDRDEDAIGALQKILDAFPSSGRASFAERRIKELLGAEHDNAQDKRERWAQALKSCDDMDIRVGNDTFDRKLKRMGLAALPAHAAELEKACALTPKSRQAFAYVYENLASEAAFHEDCDAFRTWYRKYVEADGSIGDMMSRQKHSTPWCELGDVVKSVLWFTAALNRDWTLEFSNRLVSILSHDGKVLSLDANDERMHETLSFRLETTGPGTFNCVSTRWQRPQMNETLVGTCEVTMTKLGADHGDFDEGTFAAHYVEPGDLPRKLELSDGKFRLRRQ